MKATLILAALVLNCVVSVSLDINKYYAKHGHKKAIKKTDVDLDIDLVLKQLHKYNKAKHYKHDKSDSDSCESVSVSDSCESDSKEDHHKKEKKHHKKDHKKDHKKEHGHHHVKKTELKVGDAY